MKALVFRGKCHIALEDVPVPTLVDSTDAIVRISLSGLCGSDMVRNFTFYNTNTRTYSLVLSPVPHSIRTTAEK